MDAVLAAGSGLIAGGMLLVGAAISWFVRVPTSIVAGIMAFGAGVLISALAYELVAEAHADGGLLATVGGFALGAGAFVAADAVLDRKGAANRKNFADRQAGTDQPGSGTALLIGALLDGIPESVVLGLSVAATGGLSLPIVVAIAISNLPEGLSSTAGMKAAGRSARYVFGVWGSVVLVTGVAALVGFLALQDAPVELVAVITTIAAGAMLAMVCDTMIPEAFERDRALTGLWATFGFLAAFALSNAG